MQQLSHTNIHRLLTRLITYIYVNSSIIYANTNPTLAEFVAQIFKFVRCEPKQAYLTCGVTS